jgi:hypothetical protein
MSTMGPIRRPSAYLRHYNFVIIPEPGPHIPVEWSTATIGSKFPDGYVNYLCEGAKAHVWFYPNDALEQVVEAAEDEFLFRNGLSTHTLIPASHLPGLIGHIEGTSRAASAPTDSAGMLNFGPYVNLKAGHYKLKLRFSAENNGATPPGKWDIIGRYRDPSDVTTLRSGPFHPNRKGVEGITFDIPQGGIKLVEFRSFFSGEGSLSIHSFEVSKVN